MLPSLPETLERRIVAALLLVLFAALTWQAWWLSLTVDEPSHLLSAYLYWRGRDRLYPRDMPPLIKFTGGWPSRFMRLPVAADLGRPGDKRSEWQEASDLIRRMAGSPEKLQKFIFYCRLPLVLFPLLTALLLWRWARALFSPTTGVVVAALWVLCPTVQGHGALFKNDHAATFTYLLFWYTAWCFWRDPRMQSVLLMASAAGLAVLSKNSMLFLLGIAPIVITLRSLVRPRCNGRLTAAYIAAALLVPWLVLSAAYQFDLHTLTTLELASIAAKPKAPPTWFLGAANLFRWLPIPEGLWVGVLSLFASNAASVPVYMLGQIFPEGNRLYFIVATVLKMAITTQLLFWGGLVLLWRRRFQTTDLFWLTPGFVYFALASLSSLHLGVRLVLPAWVFFILVAGVAVNWLLQTMQRRLVLGAAIAALLLMSASSYPHGLAYFNPFVGGSTNAIRYLGDSNIDWGQSLSDVAQYARDHKIDRLRLAYFGFDIPQRYFPQGNVELLVPPWTDRVTTTERLVPEKGWYAISASLLPGHFFIPQFREYYAEFRSRQPVAVAGGSIFIYRID